MYDEKYQKAKRRYEERWRQFSLEHPDAVFMTSSHKPSKTPRMTKEQQKLAAMTEEERRQFEVCVCVCVWCVCARACVCV